MFRWAKRSGRDPEKVTRSKTTFNDPLKWKEPKRIFTCSLSDFFIEGADEWRGEAWRVIEQSPQHTFMVLTKRPERIYDYEPWPHVWLGVSVENQRQADERIPKLLQIPAAKRFVSIEPLLGEIKLSQAWRDYLVGWDTEPEHGRHDERGECVDCPVPVQVQSDRLDLVIVGGESGGPEHRRLVEQRMRLLPPQGPLADRIRTLNPKWGPKKEALRWVRSLRDQCQAAGVEFHFKQFGGPKPDSGGRMLDGRTWEEVPNA